MTIPAPIASRLEKAWVSHLKNLRKPDQRKAFVDHESAAFKEGKSRKAFIRHRHREQKLRKAKIAQFRRCNKGRLFCEVKGCGFDFESVYGKLGRDYAQVHHLKPLANRSKPCWTKLDELAVVCANCHAMIHRGGKCRPLNGLIK